MAAYAAVVSSMNIIDQIMNNPRLSTSFNKKQIESLREKVGFLLDFLESYSSHVDLESRIATAAHAAGDAIESHVVDEIRSNSISKLDLHKVMEQIDCAVAKVEEERGSNNVRLPNSISKSPNLSKPRTAAKTTIMVGFEEELIELMDVLTGYESRRIVVSIVGMGGAGKTTLTRNAFENPLIVQHFDVRGWATISHNYSVKQILLELLLGLEGSDSEIDHESEDELALKLYQILYGRRYLIALDDIWSVDSWDKMKFFFPDCDNGSRVVVTTRLSNVASQFCSSSFKINFLDEDKSWDLFCRTAFCEEDCPLELEEIGKEIVEKCKGLPLSIVVIGAFLGKSSMKREYWENVVRDINSILKSDEDELCLNLLSLSYIHLPAYLKPCFLYMGIQREDEVILASQLIKLFVAEGFLKPNKTQSLEEIAEDYLKDLVDRNLILVSKWKWNGKPKSIHIHDLLREVCLREAEKERFLHVIRSVCDMEHRRIVFLDNTTEDPRMLDVIPSSESVRLLILKGGRLPFKFPLLKVLIMVHDGPLEFSDDDSLESADDDPLEFVFQQVNISYVLYKPPRNSRLSLPSSASLLWNLETLIIRGDTERVVAPTEIWFMRQLRHLKFNELCLPDPPVGDQEDKFVLQNLRSLANVVNFTFSEDVCKRIPNIEKLHMKYDAFSSESLIIDLHPLNKLQSLKCCLDKEVAKRVNSRLEILALPSSIKKLCLIGCCLHWENVNAVGMMLPSLEVLRLDSVIGREWNVEEGAFPRLRSLTISSSDLVYWSGNNSLFPVLEELDLEGLEELDEIPLDIGEIPTLRYLNLEVCSESAAISATKILEEQLSVGNEEIEVRVDFKYAEDEMSFREKVDVDMFSKKNFRCTSIIWQIRMHAQFIRAAILFRKAGIKNAPTSSSSTA